MFVVTEADAAAIRAVYQQRGEFPAAVELCRRFPGITDNAQARMWARTIAGWKPGRSAAATAGEADAPVAAAAGGCRPGGD
jgi:hypothetical protein